MSETIIGIASIPSRKASLKKTLDYLMLNKDISNIYVYLNNYRTTPGFLSRPKVEVFKSQDHGDIGDIGKFFMAGELKKGCYYFCCDDDIIYPSDYICHMKKKIDKHKCPVGVHGLILRRDRSYTRASRVHFSEMLEKDINVHILGTGTTAYHTDHFGINRNDFKKPNMADIYLALKAMSKEIDLKCIERPRVNWLRQNKDSNQRNSIYMKSINRDHIQTKISKPLLWKKL